MILQKAIDMTRPAALYLAAIAVLLLAVFIEGRTGLTLLSRVEHLQYQKAIAAVLIFSSIAFGLLGARRYEARVSQPWRVPQIQVFLCFLAFFVLGLTGICFSS
jgi:hypothetical protein